MAFIETAISRVDCWKKSTKLPKGEEISIWPSLNPLSMWTYSLEAQRLASAVCGNHIPDSPSPASCAGLSPANYQPVFAASNSTLILLHSQVWGWCCRKMTEFNMWLFPKHGNGLLNAISTEAVKDMVLLPSSLATAEPGKQALCLKGSQFFNSGP